MIVKCSHCKRILSAETFDEHDCDLPFIGVKRITVVYFRDDSYKDKKLMSGYGVDGTLYTFEVVPRKPIPFILSASDDSYHEPPNRRKVTRTHHLIPYKQNGEIFYIVFKFSEAKSWLFGYCMSRARFFHRCYALDSSHTNSPLSSLYLSRSGFAVVCTKKRDHKLVSQQNGCDLVVREEEPQITTLVDSSTRLFVPYSSV